MNLECIVGCKICIVHKLCTIESFVSLFKVVDVFVKQACHSTPIRARRTVGVSIQWFDSLFLGRREVQSTHTVKQCSVVAINKEKSD